MSVNRQGNRPRDNQRKRVYDSENAIDDRPWDERMWCHKSTRGGRLETVGEIESFLNKIHRSRWFKGFLCKQSPPVTIRKYYVKDGRGTSRGFACRWHNGNAMLNLPRWSRSKLVILHEMTHTVTPNRYAWHGPEFCANYLELVKRWIDAETHADLKASFQDHRAKYRRTGK